ncbi:hypothetical protein [Caldimonas sp. KR1-144]|uniref:hypothetical protein n=1 Tax=Caldimonas sp. KR1-144 TaxID=3400911 RepID=UPI003C00252F
MSHHITLRIAAGIALASIAFLPATTIAAPADSAACAAPERLSRVQRTLLAKAEQGGAELRRYIWLTKPIYQRDLTEVIPWLEARERAARAGCTAMLATEEKPAS